MTPSKPPFTNPTGKPGSACAFNEDVRWIAHIFSRNSKDAIRDIRFIPPVKVCVPSRSGFQKEPLSVYNGDIQIQVKVDADDKKSARILPVQLGIQACNDKICLPP